MIRMKIWIYLVVYKGDKMADFDLNNLKAKVAK